jgi:hypothetical protein
MLARLCSLLWTELCPPQIHSNVKALNLNVTVFENNLKVYKEIRLKELITVRASSDRISVLMRKNTRELFLPPYESPVRG